MITVPNQKVVKVNKDIIRGKLYTQITLDAMESAAKNLDAGAFKLWCYFAKNQDSYMFALSSKDVELTMGIKIKQYNNAVKELIQKGYLVLVNKSSNIYNFYEMNCNYKDDITTNTNSNNDDITFDDKPLYHLVKRNNTNTNNITYIF